jgi:ubiquinone/menaquinone biosynthesis C-methylase UbiE
VITVTVRLIVYLLRPFYCLLYHQFAWTYDLVASVISLGHWQEWVQVALPYLNGCVLELGFGTGHLQLSLNEKNLPVFGLDESHQMAHQASRRLRKQGAISRLLRGYAQYLPFADGVFDSVIATFPAEYIFDPQTLKEIMRVLVPAGMLVILPMAWLVAWLFRVTGEALGKPGPVSAAINDRFAHAGFEVRSEMIQLKGSQVLVMVTKKRPGS